MAREPMDEFTPDSGSFADCVYMHGLEQYLSTLSLSELKRMRSQCKPHICFYIDLNEVEYTGDLARPLVEAEIRRVEQGQKRKTKKAVR
jgi:hypothetical protein